MTETPVSSAAKLYTPRMLMLSAKLADYPLDASFPLRASARSQTCGSTIELGLATDGDGFVSTIGMQVTACAVGQSSAAILADAIKGVDLQCLVSTRTQIENWLDSNGGAPTWPGFETLLPVREYPGRHGALVLPWNAAIEALSSHASTS